MIKIAADSRIEVYSVRPEHFKSTVRDRPWLSGLLAFVLRLGGADEVAFVRSRTPNKCVETIACLGDRIAAPFTIVSRRNRGDSICTTCLVYALDTLVTDVTTVYRVAAPPATVDAERL